VFTQGALTPLPSDAPVELAELVRFFRQPVRALLKARAGLSLFEADPAPPPQIPVDLDGLQRYEVGERLLLLHLQGQELETLQAAEWRRGTLPPRAFGSRVLEDVGAKVAEVVASAGPFLSAPATKVEVATELAGRPLVGTVAGVHGDDLVQVSYAKLSARHKLTAWIQLLALAVARPGRPWRAVTVTARGVSLLGPVEPEWAARWLASLVELQDVGLQEPLPFAARTSALYAQYRSTGQPLTPPQWKDVNQQWERDWDASYACFYDHDPARPALSRLDLLREEPHRPGEQLADLVEDSRFGTLARRVFEPLLWVENRS